jgi:3-phosphoglycerate kinase
MTLPTTDSLATLEQLDVEGQRVLVRVDIDIAQQQPDAVALQVERALPTLHHLLGKRARVIVASHVLGQGEQRPPSLELAGSVLAEKLSCDVLLPDDVVGDMARKITAELRTGQIAILENLALEPGELGNDNAFAQQLAALCDAFVNEAPSLFDRKLASTIHLPRRVRARAMGINSVRVAQGLRSLQLVREHLVALVAAPELNQAVLNTLQSWLSHVHTLVVVGEASASLRAAGETGKDVATPNLSAEVFSRCRTLHEQARANSKTLLATRGQDLEQTLGQPGTAARSAPLLLVGSLASAGVDLGSLGPLLAGRTLVGAFGMPALLSLQQLPSLLAHVSVSCAAESVALRTLAGETLPSLAALTGAA